MSGETLALADFFTPEQLASLAPFRPGIGYYPAMDWLLVLMEDVGYVAEALIPGVVDILWHPQEKRVVGVKVWDVSAHAIGSAVIASLNRKP